MYNCTFEIPFIPKNISQELFVSTTWNTIYAVIQGTYALQITIVNLVSSSKVPVVAAHQTLRSSFHTGFKLWQVCHPPVTFSDLHTTILLAVAYMLHTL